MRPGHRRLTRRFLRLIPDGVLELLTDRPVPGDQRCTTENRLADDQAIEGVAGPALSQRHIDHFLKGKVADRESHLSPERLDHGLPGFGCPPDLVEILKLQLDGGRNHEIVLIEKSPYAFRDQHSVTGEQPGGDVSVEVDQGRHSPDQSTWTRSSGSDSR